MSDSRESLLDGLSLEQLRALARKLGPEVVIRRSIAGGVVSLFFAVVLGGLVGDVFSWTSGNNRIRLRLGGALFLAGLYNLARALIAFFDRSPQLILGRDALIDCRTDRRYPYAAIRGAQLHRTLRNGSEESATLSLQLSEMLAGPREVEIALTHLDTDAQFIFRTLGARADLK